jgi:signal transduction histidine kinase
MEQYPDRRTAARQAWRVWMSGMICMLMLWSSTCAGQAWPAARDAGMYQHTQWTAENGAPADIINMAQTVDGWLWLGTGHGLVRFDGLRFTRAPGELARARISNLFAAPTGDLYVAVTGIGVSVLHPDGRIDPLPGSDATTIDVFRTMAMGRDGVLWGISRAIYRHDGKRWVAVDRDPAWEVTKTSGLLLDAAGTLWAAADAGVKRLDRAHGRFEWVDSQAGSLIQAPDGSVFVVAKEGRKLVRLSAPVGPRARGARANGEESRLAGVFDAGGTLWKLHCPEPVCLAHGAPGALPVFDAQPGAFVSLSGTDPRHVLEDQEGNVWIATGRGLDRFRPSRLVRTGLAPGPYMGLAVDGDGRVWALDNDGALWELRKGQPPRREPLPPAAMVVRDRDGGILLAARRSIVRLAHGRRSEIPMPPGPDGRPRDRRPFVLVDDGRIVWVAAPGMGLMAWYGGRWHPKSEFDLPDRMRLLVPGAAGQLWASRATGDLIVLDNGKLSTYDARALGFMTGIFPGTEVVASGDSGLGVLQQGRIRLLRADTEDVLRSVSGLVVTPDGDRWLNGAAGLVHVRADDWRHALAAPQIPLRYELLAPADGYPGRALVENVAPTAASGDGRVVWVIGTEGIAAFDTAAAWRNPVRPAPRIEGVLTPRGMLAASGLVRIAPGLGRFGIEFTAPLLRVPERVRFQYRLDGFDQGWQDSGAARVAQYMQVPPGIYRFRVRASNEDGVAGDSEAALALQVEPALVQTLWFRGLCALLLVVVATLLYRYRVRYLTARVSERLRVKTAERERIARTLHDSFLQSLQAVLIRLDTVSVKLSDTTARREIETIRNHANDALVEGRGHLEELRAGDVVALDEVLMRHVQQMRDLGAGTEFVLRVANSRRLLRGEVADEVGNVAREALRNAAAHAGARKVRVVLGYGRRALTLSVADDGRGLPDDVVRDGGRPGHWGLAGMRERAERIGGILIIDSQPGRGTAIRLAVPAKRAYLSA